MVEDQTGETRKASILLRTIRRQKGDSFWHITTSHISPILKEIISCNSWGIMHRYWEPKNLYVYSFLSVRGSSSAKGGVFFGAEHYQNTTQTRPLSTVHENQPQGVRTTEPEGNLHPVSRSDPQTSPTVRVELAVPAVQAPVAGPEAFLANLWHQVRERNWYLLLLAILPLLFKLLQYKNGPWLC